MCRRPAGPVRPPPRGTTPALTFATVSCSSYEQGYFTGYRRLAEDQPDLVLHLGDCIYEYAPGGYKAASGSIVRPHTEGRCQTLTDYRRRHAQYKSDAGLRALHALAPWIPVNDDHEVENNWAGTHPGTSHAPGFTAVCRLSAAELAADFHTMPYVSRRNAPSTVAASFTVADGAHRLSRVTPPGGAAAGGPR